MSMYVLNRSYKKYSRFFNIGINPIFIVWIKINIIPRLLYLLETILLDISGVSFKRSSASIFYISYLWNSEHPQISSRTTYVSKHKGYIGFLNIHKSNRVSQLSRIANWNVHSMKILASYHMPL